MSTNCISCVVSPRTGPDLLCDSCRRLPRPSLSPSSPHLQPKSLPQALSIRQPWAWFILHGGKDIENRRWATGFRGRFYVHAAKGMTRGEFFQAIEFVREFNPELALRMPAFESLPRGGVVGQVTLADCVSAHKSPWFCGPFGFVLKDPQPLPFSPCKGELGFFDLPPGWDRRGHEIEGGKDVSGVDV